MVITQRPGIQHIDIITTIIAIILMIIITSVGISMSIKLIVNRTIDYKNKLSENL